MLTPKEKENKRRSQHIARTRFTWRARTHRATQFAGRPSLKGFNALTSNARRKCEGTDDIVGVKAPLRGVAQVVFHGVQVVEVGVQVRVHQDRGVGEDVKGQVEVEREAGEDQGEPHMHDMRMT